VKQLKTISFTIAVAAFAPAKLLACATCFGGSIDSPMADGMNWGIFTLLGVVGTMLASFLTFLIYAIRKSEALETAAQNTSPEIPKV
jgi:drug/metabolite transporter (DMT)-like permease